MSFSVKAPREIEVEFGKNVKGTIAIPHSIDTESLYNEGYAPPTNKIALLLHGQGGHRDYCYQKHLAHKLAAELGQYSLRIDFRGCGWSGENESQVRGRTLSQDIEDIQAAAEFIIDKTRNPLGVHFTFSSIISHSRGAVAMFLWAIEQDKLAKSNLSSKAIVVPNLVNCSGRFKLHTVLEKYPQMYNGDPQSISQVSMRYGKYQPVVVPLEEVMSLSRPDMTAVRHLSSDWSVLSIYGLDDRVIDIQNSACYANYLNRGFYSHKLELIQYADHNFFGNELVISESDAEDLNEFNLPLNSKKFVNYNYLVAQYIVEHLKPSSELKRFVSHSFDVGKLPRWKEVEGVSNFRDMGGWHVHLPTFKKETPGSLGDGVVKYYVKPHTLFRCANMAKITDNGLRSIRRLGIKTIFDVRSDGECANDGIPLDLEKYGIKRVHAPIFRNDDYSPQAIAMRYSNLMTSWYTYVYVYEDMLETGTECFRTIFNYIRDDGQPFLFHCTAGKDRTGMIGMLILLLLGVDKSTIAKEYELTTVGLAPEYPRLKEEFHQTILKLQEKMSTADIEALISQGRKDWTVEEDGFENLISSRGDAMLATVDMFNEKYGGIIQFMKDELKYSQADITKIFDNLIIVDENGGFETNSTLNWEHGNSDKAKI